MTSSCEGDTGRLAATSSEVGPVLAKVPTGISGLDEITFGGLPRGRTSLVCGMAGCGKTLFGLEFLVRGARDFGEPGLFVSFEETSQELIENAASLGFDLPGLIQSRRLGMEFIRIEPAEIEESGEYDLEGLFIRLQVAIDRVGARRVVLDTLEALFSGFQDAPVLRAEIRRLFRWLKDKGVTAICTAERGSGREGLTRQGLEEYVSDCVILLEHRVNQKVSTRLLRVVKYRGSAHGSNEYPFLIGSDGISVLPITSLELRHTVSNERVETGVPDLDAMMGGKGYYRGSSILVSGTAGSGKTSLSAHMVDACCRRGERCLYFSFEESPEQIVRNMRSIGMDLEQWRQEGILHIHATRATAYGLETHLVTMHTQLQEFRPAVVIVDPVSNLDAVGSPVEVQAMLERLLDFLKASHVTALFTCLLGGGQNREESQVGISSVIDTWITLRNLEVDGERNRGLYVLKSRGMPHSNQIREFVLTNHGVRLLPVYTGEGHILTGSARVSRETLDRETRGIRQAELERKQKELEMLRRQRKLQVEALEAEFEADEARLQVDLRKMQLTEDRVRDDARVIGESRRAGTLGVEPAAREGARP